MSEHNQNAHEKVEKNVGLMSVLIAVAISFGGLAQIVPLMFQAEAIEPLEGVEPWPALQLALSDADGRVLGSAVFTPEQYLGAAPATRLAPGQSAQASFLVREPAPGTVAFSFEFR